MTAINDGCYAMVAIPDPKLGPRKVDVATMYNTERYRPNYDTRWDAGISDSGLSGLEASFRNRGRRSHPSSDHPGVL